MAWLLPAVACALILAIIVHDLGFVRGVRWQVKQCESDRHNSKRIRTEAAGEADGKPRSIADALRDLEDRNRGEPGVEAES